MTTSPENTDITDYHDDQANEPGLIINDHDPDQIPAAVSGAQRQMANQQENRTDKFTIVALGGSAGSLDAFERFFLTMPPDSGMAFVVVTHISPDHEGALAQVIQQFTQMPVQEATDGQRIHPNEVYVLPSGKDMSVLHGTLLLFAPTQARGKRMPIDFFFQSLAKDARERAVCIVCSGMGSDGTIGLKMIMENFGMVMVQAPETAEYDSMPRSAIATEFVDYVLPVEQLPNKLLEYVGKPLTGRPQRESAESAAKPAHALQKIFLLIRSQTGHDFSFYKRNTVMRRIERRMNSHQIKDFTHYVRYLQENPPEVEALFKELLIGVTKFFRDADAFDQLRKHLIPLLIQKADGGTVRVWAPGCSTGEEAYSLAITLLECLEAMIPNRYLKVQLFATDINVEGIDFARVGVYPDNIAADVSTERLRRYFNKTDGGYQIGKEVRDVVVFAPHNLNKDAPFTRLDLLVCRNLLIYLSSELQRTLLPMFHYALNPGGLLFLGPSENLTGFQELFAPLDVKWKISRRLESSTNLPRLVNFPSGLSRLPATPTMPSSLLSATPIRKEGPFAALVQKTLVSQFAPPSVVINAKGEILFVNGRTGRYLEPAPGLGGLNIFEMIREELRYELGGAIHQAATTHQSVSVENAKVSTDGGFQLIRLSVKYLTEPDNLQGLMLVVFEEQPTPRKIRLGKANVLDAEAGRDAVVAALEKELHHTKLRLQTTIEEMESSLEELKSTNEELQSTNEELQSTNEEAMTNKEEMQSMNEELLTLNMQYVSKTEELSQAANDIKNWLAATNIATVFIDSNLIIKQFTSPVGYIINLIPTDVGRPIIHFATTLRYEHLARDVQQVIDRLTTIETDIQTITGEWYTMRIVPYRTTDNYIQGAVITFTDITKLKLDEQLLISGSFAESIVETVREPLLVLDCNLHILAVSRAFAERFGVEMAEVKGQPLAELSRGAWNLPILRRLLLDLLNKEDEEFDGVPLQVQVPELGARRLLVYGRRLRSHGQQTQCVLLGISETLPA